jgi:hypothetical protein
MKKFLIPTSFLPIEPSFSDPFEHESCCYTLIEPGKVSGSVLPSEAPHFPRNSVYREGGLFRVSVLASLLRHSQDTSAKLIVIPALVQVLKASRGRRSSAQLCPFEFHSQLRQIQKDAFSSCFALQSLCIPASTEILFNGFCGYCRSLSSFSFDVGCKLRELPELAFCRCISLSSISIPASIKILHKGCFEHCTSLSSVSFQSKSKLIEIEEGTFSGCSSLTSLFIPSSVTDIGGSVFFDTSITAITLEEGNSHFRLVDNFLVDFAGILLVRSFNCDPHIIIQSDTQLRRIAERAFSRCSSLKSIFIPAFIEILCI